MYIPFQLTWKLTGTGVVCPPSAANATENLIVLNAKQPWPTIIQLPSRFRADLAKALQNKDKLDTRLRKHFVTSVFEYFSRYTLYPSKNQLEEVALLIVKTYPFLKDKANIGTGYDSWYSKLYEKFRNQRKQIPDDPEVIIHRKRSSGGKGMEVASKLRRGAINWEPPFPEGEDETSIKRHTEFMLNEWARRKPDKQKIDQRMAITFPSRRRLMNQKTPLVEIRGIYPALFDFPQILAEFERIVGFSASSTGVLDSFKHNFGQVVEGILKLARTSMVGQKNKVPIEEFLELLESDVEDNQELDSSSDEKAEVAMAILPLLLQPRNGKSNQDHFVEFISENGNAKEVAKKKKYPFPFIIINGSLQDPELISLAADEQVLCTVNGGIVDATLGLMAVYYVFMFKYPAGSTNFCIYLQKCLLQIQDGRKLPSSIVAFLNALHEISNN